MNSDKAEKAVKMLEKAREILKDADNENIKKASDYLRISIRLISRP